MRIITSRSRYKLKALYLHYHDSISIKLGRMVTNIQMPSSIMLLYLWSRGLARPRDKIKTLNLPYYDVYDPQTREGCAYHKGVSPKKSHGH